MELAIIIGVVVILFIVFILASYIKAPTDRALIVSGLRKNPKFVIGKSALRIPFLQRVDKLELKMISVDVKTKESVPTNEYINVNIDSAVKIKVGSSKEMLEKAASNFLNKNEDYIRNSVGDVLEGNVREIIGQMRLEDIVQDRKMFAEKVQENAAPDMARMGLEIVSFNVQNVTDEGNVIENLGIDRVVRSVNQHRYQEQNQKGILQLPRLMQQSRQMMQESKLRLLLQKEITNLRLRNRN